MSRSPLRIAVLAACLSWAGGAWAEPTGEALSTAAHGPGYVDENAKPAAPVVAPGPRQDAGPDFEGLSRLGEKARDGILANIHGQVGAAVGSDGSRAAYGTVHGPINDKMNFSLSVGVMRDRGLFLGDPVYGPDSPFPPRYLGERTTTLTDDPPAPPPPGG
jgi:hypothetical protein